VLPGSSVNTSSEVMPSLRPLTTGASAFVKEQVDACSCATGTGEEDSCGGGTVFAGAEGISELHARNAIAIAKMIKRKNFIRDIPAANADRRVPKKPPARFVIRGRR